MDSNSCRYSYIIDSGALFVRFFHYIPVRNAAATELLPTPEQREEVYRRIREFRKKKAIFSMDFQNDAEYVGDCEYRLPEPGKCEAPLRQDGALCGSVAEYRGFSLEYLWRLYRMWEEGVIEMSSYQIFTDEVRGGGVISWENFKKINLSLGEDYTHPRNLAAAGSTHTGRIKTSFTGSTFPADISLYLVTTKIFPCELIAVQTVIHKRLSHWANKCILLRII